jgi:hypothetical protein
LTRQDFFPDFLAGEKIHRPKVMIGMIADDMACPGRGGDQGSMLPEMSANDEKGGFGLELL